MILISAALAVLALIEVFHVLARRLPLLGEAMPLFSVLIGFGVALVATDGLADVVLLGAASSGLAALLRILGKAVSSFEDYVLIQARRMRR